MTPRQDETTPVPALHESLTAAPFRWAAVLDQSRVLHLALLDCRGMIRYANRAMAECLKEESAALVAKQIGDFLAAGDAALLAGYLAETIPIPRDGFLLNVALGNESPVSLRCRLMEDAGLFLLIGEPPLDEYHRLQEELLQVNNQLNVICRENLRKGRELARTLEHLKSAQAMLIHQEKMASLGQMTAGIAHEINNPVAFVLTNEQVMKRDFGDLLAFIARVHELLPAVAEESPRIHADLVESAASLELDYLTESLPRKLSENIEGLERIRDIIKDLRTFSRLDEMEYATCRLSEGIEASLRFLKPLLAEHGVSVTTAFADLREISCAPGPLNQAVSNILANAIQASRAGQSVGIATRCDDQWITIEVKDQGEGIHPDQLARVFDPFYTTKAVGSGTGLGLSIAHQVIAAHQGRIDITSSPGAGTTVRILLPVHQEHHR